MVVNNTSSDKTERFKRIAEQRVNATLDKLRLLGQCSNRNNYEYDQSQVDAIFDTLSKELKITRAKFQVKDKRKKRFTL